MKRITILIYLLTRTFFISSQDHSEVAKGIPLIQFIKEVEDSTAYKFFYMNEWIDSIRINLPNRKIGVPEILKTELKNTKIRFYIDNYKVIFTNNTPILVGLDPTFFLGETGLPNPSLNYSFNKEDIPIDQTEKKIENKTIEIGVKKPSGKNYTTIVGFVKEKKTNEAILGAQVYLEKTNIGTGTNTAGFYSLSAPVGPYTLIVQFTGMKEEKRSIILYSEGKLDISMEEDIISLKEVVIESERDANVTNNQMGKSILDMKSIKNVPKILGENDSYL